MNSSLKTLLFLPIAPVFYLLYRINRAQYPKVMDSLTSLDILKSSGKSLARYGDGELNLISGSRIGFQSYDPGLAERLKEILENGNNEVFIGLPDVFHSLSRFKLEAKLFWLYSVVKNWKRWKQLINNVLPPPISAPKKYLDSLASRFFMDTEVPELSKAIFSKWRDLWADRDVVIVEGKFTKMGVGNDMIDNVKSIKRIVCPDKNAFAKYGSILKSALAADKNSLFLIALGPTATVLAYDLGLQGRQAIDSGHLDLEYNWMKADAKKKVAVEGRAVNELGINKPPELRDSDYESQIIKMIT